MQAYILRRLLVAIPVILLVSLAVFSLVRVLPGDALLALTAEAGFVGEEAEEELRATLGLDKSYFAQYASWMGGIFQGDLGVSLLRNETVAGQLSRAIPVTVQLAIMTILLTMLIAVPVGIISAIRQDSIPDYTGRMVSITGLSVPDFLVATLVIVFVGIWFKWSPPITHSGFFEDPVQNLKGTFIPAAILGLRFSATGMRMVRSTMLEVLREDYIRTAWAKGLRERTVVTRHALKNAFIPVVTIFGTEFSYLMGGAVIIETIFNLPGVGQLTLESILNRDYPQVQANVLLVASVMIFMNLLVDISYAWLDPRIHYGNAAS